MLQVVTLDGENALPKKLGLYPLRGDISRLMTRRPATRPRAHPVRAAARPGARGGLKGCRRALPVQTDGSSYMSFKDALPHQ